MKLLHLAGAALALAASDASADTLTCRNGRIVQPGMTTSEVLDRCGEPTSKDVRFVRAQAKSALGRAIGTGEAKVETWRYDRGTQKPAAILVIDEGKITSIAFE